MSKRDFGSFHASNVQELLEIPEESYTPPELPFQHDFPEYQQQPLIFGPSTRHKHFLLEDSCTFLNHGAFGSVLKEGLQICQAYQSWTERQPLRFFDRELLPRLVHVTRRLAKFVGCNARDLVLMTNATTALNTVIRSIPLEKGDAVFCLSVTYGAVNKMLQWACDQAGAKVQEVKVTFPVQDKEQIIRLVRDNLQPGTKLAVFDHIPSNTPFILPLQEIIDICRQRGVPVLVDGAHALGSLPLGIQDLGPDYYVANAHKWLCCPKGTAFMYVRQELQGVTRPLIVSHGFGSGFNSEFIWTGLHDYSPFLAMHTVLDFWQTVGEDRIRQYIHDLCRQAGHLLTDAWGTSLAAPDYMFGSMSLVGLPASLYSARTSVDYSAAEHIQNRLFHDYNIEVPVKCLQDKLYVRISAHIYNDLSQYQTLADAVLDIVANEDSSETQT